MDVVIFTGSWTEDHSTEEGEKPNAQIGFRVFVDGEEVKRVMAYKVKGNANDFQTIDLELPVSSLEFRQIPIKDLRNADTADLKHLL